jgi:hypothetical protein
MAYVAPHGQRELNGSRPPTKRMGGLSDMDLSAQTVVAVP